MVVKATIHQAKILEKTLAEENIEEIFEAIKGLADAIQVTVEDNKIWPMDDLKKFNGLMKYVLLSIENGDFQFGKQVISNDIIPLLSKQIGTIGDEESNIEENIDDITKSIKGQYTDFAYPNFWNGTIPSDLVQVIMERNITSLFNLLYIQHIGFEKYISVKNLEVLVAGCGTGESAIMCAMGYPEAFFTFVDISSTSLAMARGYIQELGLSNVKIIQADIMTMSLERQFDIIISTGVIHHLSVPSQGVRNLNKHLKPEGILSAMVYGEYGRFEIGLFQDVIKTVLGQEFDFSHGINIAKHFFEEVEPSNRLVNIAWKEDIYKGDQHIVDLLLNVNEHRYSVKSLSNMLKDGGMRILEFTNSSTMNPENYFKDQGIKDLLSKLSYLERCAVAEKINGNVSRINFYAIKNENNYRRLSIYDKESKNYNIHKSPYLVEMVIRRSGKVSHVLNIDDSNLDELNVSGYKDINVDNTLMQMIDLCDGTKTVGQIFTRLKGQIDINKAKEFINAAVGMKMLFLHTKN